MTDQDSVAQLLKAALTIAKDAEGVASQTTNPQEQRAAAEKIEAAAIDVTSAFEARMQHHFRRGPFFKEVQKRMLAAGDAELATKVIQYSHAVNVLKHGHGKSHRDLLNMNHLPFRVRPRDRDDTDIGLVDVLSPRFFDGLIETLKEAQAFLENAQD